MKTTRITQKNCIKFEGQNLPCKNIHFKNFDNIQTFDCNEFQKEIKNIYGNNNENFKGNESPFVFPINYTSLNEKKGLKQQQKFVASYINYHTNVNGCLIYHGTGSGKTCTSIIVGEAIKAFHEFDITNPPNKKPVDTRKIIVVTPAQVKAQYMKEVQGQCASYVKINNNSQNYTKNLTRDQIAENPLNAIEIDNYVSNFWIVITHSEFINDIKDDKKNIYLNILKKPKNLLIIDEIHKLVSDTGKSYKTLFNNISYHVHPDNKIILMSATPIYDKPYELGLTLNLLRPRLLFPTNDSDFRKLFIDPETKEMINEDLFRWMCTGYVSYFKGGNPRDFPYTRNIVMHHPFVEGSNQYSSYITALMSELPRNTKKDDIFDKEISSFFSKSQMYSNICFNEKVSVKDKLNEFKKNLKNIKDNKGDVLEYVKQNYSVKYANVVKLILNSVGTVFVFSNYTDYGVIAMSEILKTLDYEEYHPLKSDKSRNIKKPRYVIWTGSTSSGNNREKFLKNIKLNFNNTNNKDGQFIKVILGTTAIMEGISLRNVRNVHILTPWWNDSRIKQIQARAIRLNSHNDLAPSDRYVNIYTHVSVLHTYPNTVMKLNDTKFSNKIRVAKSMKLLEKSIELYIFEKAEQKKKFSRKFEYILKQSSVDCDLNKYGNIQRLSEIIEPRYTGRSVEYYPHYENYSTGDTYIKENPKIYDINEIPAKIGYDDSDTSPFKLLGVSKQLIGRTSSLSNYEFVLNGKDIEYDSKTDNITHDLITNENIICSPCKMNTIKSGDFSGKEKSIEKMIEFSTSLKIIPNFKSEKSKIIECAKKHLEQLGMKEIANFDRELQKLITSQDDYINAIDEYIKSSPSLGDYLTNRKTIIKIIDNNIIDELFEPSNENKPIVEELIKNSGKTVEEIREIFENIADYVSTYLNIKSES